MSTYKVMVTQIVNNENIGSAILTTDFTTLENAISTGNERRLNNLCPIEVREYNKSKNNIISFDERDTGVSVYRNVSGIIDAIQEAYHQSDNVFSEMLDFILEYQDDELHAAAHCLTDEEINRLLKWAGDDEWNECVDGQIVAVE